VTKLLLRALHVLGASVGLQCVWFSYIFTSLKKTPQLLTQCSSKAKLIQHLKKCLINNSYFAISHLHHQQHFVPCMLYSRYQQELRSRRQSILLSTDTGVSECPQRNDDTASNSEAHTRNTCVH